MNNWFKAILSFVLIFLWTCLVAQKFRMEQLDSLEQQFDLVSDDSTKVEILLDLIDRAEQMDINLMFQYSRQLLAFAKNIGSQEALLYACQSMSSAYDQKELYDSGIYYADLGIKIGLENNLNVGGIYYSKGRNLVQSGDTDDAVTYFLKSINYYDSIGDTDAAHPRNGLANIYMEREKHEDAIALQKWVFDTGEQLEDLQLMAMSSYNMSISYMVLGNWDKAREMQETSLRCSIASNDSVGIAYNYTGLGKKALYQEEYALAVEKYKSGLIVFEKINKAYQAKELRSWISMAYLGLGNLDSAYYYAYGIYQDDANPLADYYVRAIESLAEIHERRGDYKKALFYQQQYNEISDSIAQNLYDEQVLVLEKTLEKERIEKEKNELAASQAKLALVHEQEIRKQRMVQISAFASAGVVLLILLILYVSYKRKRRDNEKLAAQNKKIVHQADELQSKNKQLEELSNFKEGLTHMIAHDMKNSLNSIIGFSAKDLDRKEMQDINRSGNVLLNLVTNMLDVQRFEEADIPLSLQEQAVHQIVAEAHSQIRLLLQMKSLRFNSSKIPEGIFIKTDKEIMVRVLVNLLINAIKYSPAGGSVVLKVDRLTREEHHFLAFSVIDQGDGISEEQLPHLFDKFWQADKKPAGQAASTGLGLTFCKLAVEAHGGKIEVESKVGEGATFRVLLPFDSSDESWNEDQFVLDTSSGEEVLILDEERELIVGFQERLKLLEVYQVGELKSVLEQMEVHQLQSLWKSNLETAVHQGDEKTYKDLVYH